MTVPARQAIANVDRLHRLMDEDNLSAVVLSSGENFTYLSGIVYPGTLGRHLELANSPRAVIVLWPRNGEPVLVVNATAEGLARRDSWIRRVELYEAYLQSPYGRLAEILKDEGLAGERVGFEKDFVNAGEWGGIQSRLPDLTMVDCTELMDRARWIKTEGEIALIKQAADLLDEAYLEVFPTIRVGERELDVHGRILQACIAKGFGWAHGILHSSRNTIPYAGESDFVLEPGDVIRTDYVAYYHAYPGHQSRNIILGEPTPDQLRDYRINRDVYRAAIDDCQPGARVGDIYTEIVDRFAKHGWDYRSIIAGHSVGPWMHQQNPIVTRASDARLEEGMVIAMEPHWRYWHLQDMMLVTERGPKLLSDMFSTDEPLIVA